MLSPPPPPTTRALRKKCIDEHISLQKMWRRACIADDIFASVLRHYWSSVLQPSEVPSLRSKRFRVSSSKKLGREQKQKEYLFFGPLSNFRAKTRLEMPAT